MTVSDRRACAWNLHIAMFLSTDADLASSRARRTAHAPLTRENIVRVFVKLSASRRNGQFGVDVSDFLSSLPPGTNGDFSEMISESIARAYGKKIRPSFSFLS